MPEQPLDDLDAVTHWFFAVGGLQTPQDRLPINRAISLHRLTAYPRSQDLAMGLRDLVAAGCMASYGEEAVQHELIVDAGEFSGYEEVLLTAGLVLGTRPAVGRGGSARHRAYRDPRGREPPTLHEGFHPARAIAGRFLANPGMERCDGPVPNRLHPTGAGERGRPAAAAPGSEFSSSVPFALGLQIAVEELAGSDRLGPGGNDRGLSAGSDEVLQEHPIGHMKTAALKEAKRLIDLDPPGKGLRSEILPRAK